MPERFLLQANGRGYLIKSIGLSGVLEYFFMARWHITSEIGHKPADTSTSQINQRVIELLEKAVGLFDYT